MKINSPLYGSVNYCEEDIITFNKPLLGFEELSKFIIKSFDDESPFILIQSIEDVNIGFIAISPFEVENQYEIKLSDDVVETLKIEKQDDVQVLSIVTVNSDIEKITANLKAPIVINVKEKTAQQFILDKEEYKIKHPLVKR